MFHSKLSSVVLLCSLTAIISNLSIAIEPESEFDSDFRLFEDAQKKAVDPDLKAKLKKLIATREAAKKARNERIQKLLKDIRVNNGDSLKLIYGAPEKPEWKWGGDSRTSEDANEAIALLKEEPKFDPHLAAENATKDLRAKATLNPSSLTKEQLAEALRWDIDLKEIDFSEASLFHKAAGDILDGKRDVNLLYALKGKDRLHWLERALVKASKQRFEKKLDKLMDGCFSADPATFEKQVQTKIAEVRSTLQADFEKHLLLRDYGIAGLFLEPPSSMDRMKLDDETRAAFEALIQKPLREDLEQALTTTFKDLRGKCLSALSGGVPVSTEAKMGAIQKLLDKPAPFKSTIKQLENINHQFHQLNQIHFNQHN